MQQILYIPGLGDAEATKFLADRWEKPDREVVTFDTRWASNEPYTEKYQRLLGVFGDLSLVDDIEVIAQSAGGALATRLISEKPEINQAAIICGKLRNAETIGDDYRKRGPALYDAVVASEKALETSDDFASKVTVYRPLREWVVPMDDMIIEGARIKKVPIIGHAACIGFTMLFYVP